MLLSKQPLLTTFMLCTFFAVSAPVFAKISVKVSAQDSEAKNPAPLVPLVSMLNNQPEVNGPRNSNAPTTKSSKQPAFKSTPTSKPKPTSKPAAKPEFKKAKKEKHSQ